MNNTATQDAEPLKINDKKIFEKIIHGQSLSLNLM